MTKLETLQLLNKHSFLSFKQVQMLTKTATPNISSRFNSLHKAGLVQKSPITIDDSRVWRLTNKGSNMIGAENPRIKIGHFPLAEYEHDKQVCKIINHVFEISNQQFNVNDYQTEKEIKTLFKQNSKLKETVFPDFSFKGYWFEYERTYSSTTIKNNYFKNLLKNINEFEKVIFIAEDDIFNTWEKHLEIEKQREGKDEILKRFILIRKSDFYKIKTFKDLIEQKRDLI